MLSEVITHVSVFSAHTKENHAEHLSYTYPWYTYALALDMLGWKTEAGMHVALIISPMLLCLQLPAPFLFLGAILFALLASLSFFFSYDDSRHGSYFCLLRFWLRHSFIFPL